MKEFEIDIPSISDQINILKKLLPIDKKIEVNNAINDNLALFSKLIWSKLKKEKEVKIKDICTISSGKRPKSKHKKRSDLYKYPVIGANGCTGWTNEFLVYDKYISTGRVGTLGTVKIQYNHTWPSDNTLIIKSQKLGIVEQIFKEIDYTSLNVGSTQPLIKQSDLLNKKIKIPADFELNKYSEIFNIIIEQKLANIRENIILNNIKKSLLKQIFNN